MFCHYCDVEPSSRVLLLEKAKGCVLANLALTIQSAHGQIYLCDFKADHFDIGQYRGLQYMQIENARDCISVIPPSMIIKLNDYKDQLMFTHFVVCAQVNLVEMIDLVHPHLLPGARIVIYSRFISPLESLANRLFDKKEYIDIQVRDIHMRKIQVLGLRTHPLMSGNQYSGFILTAYRIKHFDI